MQTFQALVFIIKALINLILYTQQLIKKNEFEKRMNDLQESVEKAINGPLSTRVQGGQEIEDALNHHAGKNP